MSEFDPKLDLRLDRVVDVPPALVWRAWTEPELIMRWFTPKPWRTTACDVDLRPGGKFRTVMEGPNGERNDNTGCYCEIITGKKLVWTDSLGPGFRPRDTGFMTAILTFEAAGAGTRYIAEVRHKDVAGRAQHEAMGFATGWSTALDQLVALLKAR